MRPPILLTLGAGVGALLVRQHRESQRSARLAAAALETLLNAIDANDAVTGAHVRRVAAYSMTLGRAADLDETTIRSIERVALFHDIGKIHEALFDIVHDDDGDVTPDERSQIATHPQRGADVLHPLSFFYPDLSEGVLAHHERWDGSGYPRGLVAEDIPIQARVVAIADTFDAITHSRRYRPAHSFDEAVRVLAEGSGTQFDPVLVATFLSPNLLARVRRMATRSWRKQEPPPDDERRHREEAKAPDVKFRWRAGPLASPP
ncbi:MAG TPA: HD domain-containing phosphohydrolase [Gemmatimonadaceae bacterium]|nr:HD domain-containing phosphohydrolase [Gemmatimonadaceae bacterium]